VPSPTGFTITGIATSDRIGTVNHISNEMTPGRPGSPAHASAVPALSELMEMKPGEQRAFAPRRRRH
jgi:hypothetical protein